MLPSLDKNYWNDRWKKEDTSWDLGGPAPALVEYFTQIKDKSARILIPGCGNAYEAEYLHRNGFSNVYVIDIAPEALKSFAARVPDFPADHLICADFFTLDKKNWDYIIEQTFFCAINPSLRPKYVNKMHELLAENGVLAGLLFDDKLNDDRPPFGGNAKEYGQLFSPKFNLKRMEKCGNSIPPRAGRELWIEFTPKN